MPDIIIVEDNKEIGTRPVIFKIERIDIPENDEKREWLAKQNFKNSVDED